MDKLYISDQGFMSIATFEPNLQSHYSLAMKS